MSRQSQELDLNPLEWDLVVTLDKERFVVKTCWGEDGLTVDIDGKKEVVLKTNWLVGEPMMLAEMNGKEVTVQVSTCWISNSVAYCSTDFKCNLVLSAH